MARFAPVPVPRCHGGARPERLAAEVAGWVTSAPMRALVAAFGGGWPPDRGLDHLLEWLETFSGTHWDFRGGALERYEVSPPEFDRETAALVMAAATALRLVTPAPPPLTAYDHVLVPGGLARACLQRTHFAAFLLRACGVSAPEVTALGSYRPLTAAERALPPLSDGDVRYELDAMHLGVRRAFGVTDRRREAFSGGDPGHHAWAVDRYRPVGDGPVVHVLAAPSSEPDRRRADTPDTYHFWARRLAVRPEHRILIVTSPIHVPFQHCEAIRVLGLPYGCGIDTVGFDVSRSTALPPVGPTAPDRYLQEIRAVIRSMRALLRAAAAQKSRYTHGSARGNSVEIPSQASAGTAPSPRATISSGPSAP
ncbi:hypothetical protein [Catenuloplanes atrovinosus]|uniref:Uncharacterized protein n=1 Tax=Catenuloplanes atrovinosus TaxID=137266 RepID=A0AAE3YRF3_9ACTN|nr:hypothetical protein [Catenuloplanes atrovinosus]MDR7278494.1 hypothetical protein [Catenuloplanes atrovinosus]